jgi:hypothetical protein
MNLDILLSIISGLASLLAGGLFTAKIVQDLLKRLFPKLFPAKQTPPESFSDRLSRLTTGLTKASMEVDRVLDELAQVARDRETAVKVLESNLTAMEQQEKELKKKIETLEKVPIAVADQFAKLLETGEKRSAKRDYLLFGAGVLVSTIIAVVLKLAGWG